MTGAKGLQFDEIGYWSEFKLDIIKEYAGAYSQILSAQRNPPLHHSYIDAFAGAGKHISRKTGTFVAGSPLNALQIQPPFKEYHFIELDNKKVDSLRTILQFRHWEEEIARSRFWAKVFWRWHDGLQKVVS